MTRLNFGHISVLRVLDLARTHGNFQGLMNPNAVFEFVREAQNVRGAVEDTVSLENYFEDWIERHNTLPQAGQQSQPQQAEEQHLYDESAGEDEENSLSPSQRASRSRVESPLANGAGDEPANENVDSPDKNSPSEKEKVEFNLPNFGSMTTTVRGACRVLEILEEKNQKRQKT